MKKLIAVLAVIVIAIVGFAAFKGSETPQKATNKISIITSTDFYAELAQTVVGDHGTATAIIKHDNISPKTMNPQQPLPKKSTD